jgi:hypothetical protein
MPHVQVVIPNWNGRKLLSSCLEALHAQTFEDFTILVVDNGSTDGSITWVNEHFPSVQVLANERNRGFAAAINQGIEVCDCEYVATLNNDAEAEPGWLKELVKTAEEGQRVGMCASKMLFANHPGIINSAGISLDWLGIAWDRRGGQIDVRYETAQTEVFGPCAGAALYRRVLFEEVGGFDEKFFAYLEDVDLAWRARRKGWRCFFNPQARVLHHHSATSREGSPFKSYHLGRNKVWLLIKNYPFLSRWYYVPLVVSYDLLAVFYALVVRGDVYALKGRLDGLLEGYRFVRKRREGDCTLDRSVDYMEPVDWPWEIVRRYRHFS